MITFFGFVFLIFLVIKINYGNTMLVFPFVFSGVFVGVCSSLKTLTNSLALLPPRGASNLSPLESGLALLTYLADKI